MTAKVRAAFRGSRSLRAGAAFLALGVAYYAFVRLTGITLFCPFQKLTGLACPGCGMAHMCTDILELRFYDAFRENAAAAVILPFLGISAACVALKKGAAAVSRSRPLNIALWVCVALLVAFGIVRNLPGCEFLLPSYLR